MAWKVERTQKEIVKQLAVILHQQEWSAERVTIVSADISAKLDYVHIYVSIWPPENEQKVIKELNSQKGLIKKELAVKLRMRLMPDIGFYVDRGAEAATKVAQLLSEIEES